VTWRARARAAWRELRTVLTGVDPGLVRLRLATAAVVAMLLAIGVMTGVRALSGQPVTVVLMAGVLAMVSNLGATETDPHRLRGTIALMGAPVAVAVTAGTVIEPYRIAADAVFVLIMAVAAWARRFGPRGSALGMPAVMGFFFTQFLQVKLPELPWLLLAAGVGLASTLLVRGFLAAEDPERSLVRLRRSFGAHVHGMLLAVSGLLEAGPGERDRAIAAVTRRRTRLNETALLIADQLERARDAADDGGPAAEEPADPDPPELHLLDAELSAERLAVATRRLALEVGPAEDVRRPLLAGLRSLESATAVGVADGLVPALLDGARRSVAPLAADTQGLGDRAQRVAFAITRLADALGADEADGADMGDLARPDRAGQEAPGGAGRTTAAAHEPPHNGVAGRAGGVAGTPSAARAAAPRPPGVAGPAAAAGSVAAAGEGTRPAAPDEAVGAEPGTGERKPGRLDLHTRQAVQVAAATTGAIIAGELISPSRWYWAVITAFIVFAGTTSRGDVLSRGSQRVVGTIGGVLAGMGLAVVVGGDALPALILLFLCVFLALYLVRVSQALMAFWITAVLALLYGLIGQFSVETLLVRIEETVAGAAMGMLAGYLILPQGTRAAFGDALDDVVAALHATLDAAAAQLLGRAPADPPLELVHDLDTALGVLRARAKPLDSPLPRRRGRSSWQRALRVFTGADHYARRLVRISDDAADPAWAPTFEPALDRVRANIDGLVALLLDRDGPAVSSAEDDVDAAEAHAARVADHRLRAELLMAARLLRRIDQAVVGFASDLAPEPPRARPGPAR
jgi:Fusaric acid resistance protein-like